MNAHAMVHRCLDGFVSGPAGQEIKKQPFAEIPRPMSVDQPIAVTVGPNLHRQLRPIM